MQSLRICVAACLFCAAITGSICRNEASAQAPQEKEWTAESLQNLYMKFLKHEGYTPHVDSDGDVVFRYQGGKYFIDVNAKDPEFIRVGYAAFWSAESDDERQAMLDLHPSPSPASAESLKWPVLTLASNAAGQCLQCAAETGRLGFLQSSS